MAQSLPRRGVVLPDTVAAPATVLLVEDDPKIARLLRAALEPQGFELLHAPDGESGLRLFERERPDVVVLDVGLPGMDGVRVLESLRVVSDAPVLMLTALSEEADRVRGLEAGADDYVTKPFSPRELVARIRAVLRRARVTPEPERPAFDDGTLRIEFDRRAVLLRAEPVRLTRTEFQLLKALADSPGRVFLHDDLKERVWGRRVGVSDDLLRAFVRALRRKIEPEPGIPRYLLTHPGVGYSFRAPTVAPSVETGWRGSA